MGKENYDYIRNSWRWFMQNYLFERVGNILEQARSNAKTAVNLSMVYAYYEIGKQSLKKNRTEKK